MSKNPTQLTAVKGYDVSKMSFSEPQAGEIPGQPPIKYKRINISTQNDDGSIGDLVLPTSRLFSFGVSENISKETKKVNGYVLPICLYTKDGAKPEEKEWVETFNSIVDTCKEHVISHRKDIQKPKLEMNDLKKFNPLYYKKDENTGDPIPGVGPTLYAKLIVSKKQNKIISQFYDENGTDIDPFSLMGKYCFVNAAIKIESIFVGRDISLQVKLYETEIKLTGLEIKPLMKRPDSKKLVQVSTSSRPLDDEGDIPDDESSSSFETQKPSPVVEKKPPKKIVKKVVKKIMPEDDE